MLPTALQCTSNTNENTPYYKYLPFDESICSSAVGCSVLGKAVNKCKALWVAGYSASPLPKVRCSLTPPAGCRESGGKGGLPAGLPSSS